jgi:pimeloyl-ACP methyl ester carboxylesterase
MQTNRFETTDGLSLAWYEAGHGDGLPPIIMQHGFSSSFQHEWVECGLAEAVAGLGRRVIGIDARGHGQSDKPHETRFYGGDRMPADISTLADHLGFAQYDLVGYSMGGGIAAAVAAQDGRVRRVVISGMGEALVRRGGLERRVLDPVALAAGLRASSSEGLTDVVKAFRDGAIKRNNDLLALAAHTEMIADRQIDFGAITARTLVMAGDTDPLAPHPEVIAAAIAGAELVLVPGDHHFSRRSPEYRQALLDFLA